MDTAPELTVVVPVHNEEANVAPLVDEIVGALRGRVPFEIVYVDDASRDGTPAALAAAMARTPELRVVRHARQSGQSAALRNGVAAARGAWVATLDGDGQNDPADLPKLWDAKVAADAKLRLFAGWRVDRRDTLVRRLSSKIANGVRRAVLKDDTPDTGCGTKLFHRHTYLELPAFDHMHRFLPALFRRAGWHVQSVPVRHRPRTQGVSKYGIGNRLFVGIVDLFGVAWLMRRVRNTDTTEVGRDSHPVG